jgi:hypothetical protein
MDYFAGLDVSLETANVCIVDAGGNILLEKKVDAEPVAIVATLEQFGRAFKRVGLEAGPTSSWLFNELRRTGYPAICLECRHVKAGLGAMRNKTDRNGPHRWLRQLTPSADRVAKLGRPILLNPSCPPTPLGVEHAKKPDTRPGAFLLMSALNERS